MTDTSDLPVARELVTACPGDDCIALGYEARMVRRRRLVSRGGLAFLVDLPETRSVNEGEAFALDGGGRVAILAEPEPVLEVRGALPRLAWHIGNRHTPCEVRDDHLRILADHVLVEMLKGLGADLTPLTAPFRPEGGAYGHGRTLGHSHDPAG